MYFLLSFLLFVTSIAVCLVYSYQMVYAMILGYVLLAAAAMRRGSRLTVLRASALGVKEALLVIEILLLIGLLTAEWRAGGVIAFFVYHGVGLITPKLFILIAFLLTCFISYALGTSIGVAGTAGVILMAIARSGGVNELLAAGAILSGVYFGAALPYRLEREPHRRAYQNRPLRQREPDVPYRADPDGGLHRRILLPLFQ